MKPADIIVQTLVASIKANQSHPFDPELYSGYEEVKSILRLRFPEVDILPLERRPDSPHSRALFAEELNESSDVELSQILISILSLAQLLIEKKHLKSEVIGVDLSNVTAENLTISDIHSSGVGAQVTDGNIGQDIDIANPGIPGGAKNVGPDTILTNVQAGGDINIRYDADLPSVMVKELRDAYLQRVFKASGRLVISQVSSADGLSTELNLKDLFVPLLIRRTNWLDIDEQEVANTFDGDTLSSEHWMPPGYESALQQINRYQWLLIIGGPGSGKSSLVKFLSLCMAGELLGNLHTNVSTLFHLPNQIFTGSALRHTSNVIVEKHAWAHGGLLPIYISLQDFAANGFPKRATDATADQLLKYLDKVLEDAELEMYAPHLRRELRTNGGILLLDGVDEVPNEQDQRTWVQQAIADFALSYGKVRVVVTSRPYAVPEHSDELRQFRRVLLAPFNPTQIDSYVEYACPLMLGTQSYVSGEIRAKRTRNLQSAIRHSHSLGELAQSPLLLTLMVYLFAQRGGTLPERREELFAEGVDLLLRVWEQPKLTSEKQDIDGLTTNLESDFQSWHRLPHERMRQALEELAFRAHQAQPTLDGTASISEESLLVTLVRATEHNRGVHPLNLREYLRHRSGILIEEEDAIYRFPHRTIQEYMAACHLHRHDDFPRNIISLAHVEPQRWREVLLFAAAKEARIRAYAVPALINRLCPRSLTAANDEKTDQSEMNVENAALMAMLCGRLLIETGFHNRPDPDEIDREFYQRVQRLLIQLINEGQLAIRDRLTAAIALGTLGDLRPGVGLGSDNLPQLEWHLIQTGPFPMGVDGMICQVIRKSFAISRYPITVGQFNSFVEAGGYQQAEYWTAEGWHWLQHSKISGPATYKRFPRKPNQPQVGVSWYEAVAFCNWISTELAQNIRLPSEPQWERSARGTDGRLFPWGNQFAITDCNMRWTGIGYPSPVGLFHKNISPCGAVDMAGNVWEWCATAWQPGYQEYESKLNNNLEGRYRRVLRGGSWANQRRFVRCAGRHRNHPDHRGPNVGFRVVRE